MQRDILSRRRHHERGQTIILVAISLVSLLAMAALAIDIVTLYAARSEMQRAADAAALAGAKAIADSGITTLLLADPNFATVQSWATTAATNQVNGVLQNNLIAGQAPTLASDPIDWSRQGNPHITVTLNSPNLPSFFSKIWGGTGTVVAATATAEAYNPGNIQNFTPIAPKVVKPWLVANIDPNSGTAFINTANGNIETGVTVIGETLNLTADCVSPGPGCTLFGGPSPPPPGIGPADSPFYPQVEYVPALVTTPGSPNPNVCPSTCTGATDYEQSIECADVTSSYQVVSCGGGATNTQWANAVYPGGQTGLSALGAECLINATTHGLNKGQDKLDNLGPWPTSPMQITAESGAQKGNFVTTSSSIVTIPIIDNTPANFQTVSPYDVTVVGFLQAFINEVRGGNPSHQGDIDVTVLNVVGCSNNSTNSGVTPVVGGSSTSPIPVRLITPP
ncbi:MAG: pilus assembly protein TadG-related protein [Terriglobales bacterium]|jgi:putative Flp pilus-assembly TadE/G-like protein